MQSLRKFVPMFAMLSLALLVGGCVVAPARPYHGSYWISGHWTRDGAWVPGHYR